MNAMEPEETASPQETAPRDARPAEVFPVVAIGASAGGLEAVRELLAGLPADTGMAYVLIQHLDPNHESKLVELLGRAARVPVVEAADGMEVRPDTLFIIPRNTTMTLAAGALRLVPRGERAGPHLPVDRFFESMAQERGARSIGVILSGTGTDGTLGLEEIKAAGGFTFAQDEASAKHSGMPQSAIRSGCVDLVLPPPSIARELARIGCHPLVAPIDSHGLPCDEDEAHFRKIMEVLHASTGVDFSGYRESTLRRRIMRRVVIRTGENLKDYVDLLGSERGEAEALYHDILISVTSFFRDPGTFEALKAMVFPEIMKGRDPNAPIRVWVAGCSTGQEAYSLAIVLLEFLEDKPVRPTVQIFATDLSDAVSLQRAREGIFPKNIEAQVSPERLRRYFSRTDDHYRISRTIRDMCVFARQDVVADPPFSHVDLISCRNLLIYLGTPLQKRVIPAFHYALNPKGFLLLGPSETVGSHNDLFAVVDPRHRIYAKKLAPGRNYPSFAAATTSLAPRGAIGSVPSVPTTIDWQREADRVALTQYVPPGVLVNDDLEILQFRGQTGPFLQPAPGEPSFNLMRMAREGLLKDLREAIDEAKTSGSPVLRRGVGVREAGRVVREINLRVLPVRPAGAGIGCALILFEPSGPAATDGAASPESTRRAEGLRGFLGSWLGGAPAPGREPPADSDAGRREVEQLRSELVATRDYLQAITEQHDASVEELRSAHEEILSSNEELQSSNEELETAKEELQSVNEELTTVNEQLHVSNRDLTRLNDDLTNLLGSADLPMIVVGVDLCIRRFTPAAGKVLGLLPVDVGRAIAGIRMAVEIPDLAERIGEVIDAIHPSRREVRDRNDRWHELRIHPYRTAENRIDGAVVMLIDIHEIKTVGARLREALDIVETVRQPLLVLDEAGRIKSANQAFFETFHVAPKETLGRRMHELGNGQWDIPRLRELLEDVLPRQRAIDGFEVEQAFEEIGHRKMILNARRLESEPGEPGLVMVAVEDVTHRERVERSLEQTEERLRLLLENVRDYAVYFLDPAGQIASWDEGATLILGYRAEEVLGRSGDIFFTPEDREAGMPGDELRTAEAEGRASDENWMVRKDGTRFWASGATTALRDERGGLRGYVKILRDLTARMQTEEALRESEHRLRVALSAAQMGTWHWDILRNRQTLDENLARLCGLGPEEQVRTLEDFLRTIHPEDRASVAAAFDRSVREGSNFDVEFRVAWPDGTVRWLKDQGDVFHDGGGRPLYMTGACVDITFRKQAEDELRRARDELERRVRERTAELVTANTSLEEQFAQRRELLRKLATAEEEERRRISRELHDEMGQYLTALILELKLLRDDVPEGSPTRARLERLQQVTNQIGQEVHRLAVELRPTALDDLGLPKTLRNYLEEWSALTSVSADFHATGLMSRPPIEVETTVYRITQEALTNVAKHAEARRVSVILETRDGDLTLIVEDDGRGFDVEAALKGSGDVRHLGLLGMSERLAALGGTLTIESSPGGPTTLYARIPMSGDGERGRDGEAARLPGG